MVIPFSLLALPCKFKILMWRLNGEYKVFGLRLRIKMFAKSVQPILGKGNVNTPMVSCMGEEGCECHY
jgi:hypothetical protein